MERERPYARRRAHPVKVKLARTQIEIAGLHEARALRFDAREAGAVSSIDAEVIVHDELPLEYLHPAVLAAVIVDRRDGSGRPVEKEHLETLV
jgi:hypothetical protein